MMIPTVLAQQRRRRCLQLPWPTWVGHEKTGMVFPVESPPLESGEGTKGAAGSGENGEGACACVINSLAAGDTAAIPCHARANSHATCRWQETQGLRVAQWGHGEHLETQS